MPTRPIKTTSDLKTDQYLIDNYLTVAIKAMAKHIGRSHTFVYTRMRQLKLVVPPELALERKTKNTFKPGNVSANKGKAMTADVYEKVKHTMFKKGQLPHNTKYDGHERISEEGYVEIRVRNGKYVFKHRLIWEAVHGKIPPKHVVVFKDRDKGNVCIENLELITMKENMLRNTINRFPEELKSTIRLVNKLKRVIDEKQN
jgi:hypothetical protein